MQPALVMVTLLEERGSDVGGRGVGDKLDLGRGAAKGFKYILTAMDRATCYPIWVPLKSTDATKVWLHFEDNWIGTFGVPTLLISEQGAQFKSNYWAEQYQMFGIRSKTTPAYHPEANGMVE